MKMTFLLLRIVPVLLICIGGFGCAHIENRSGSGAAIHQVGLVWLKQAGDAEDRQRIIDAVHEFEESIPEVKSAIVGETDGVDGPYSDTSYDVCFILTFKDEASRQRYAEHPIHQNAATNVFLPLSRKLLFYRLIGH
jgi:hypothetical protein